MNPDQEFWLLVLTGGWISLMIAVVLYQIFEHKSK